MDHQPYALPEALALDKCAVDMFNRGDYAAALPLFQQVLVMMQTAHATAATANHPQCGEHHVATGRYETATR